MVDSPSSSWGKRGVTKYPPVPHHHHHHLTVPRPTPGDKKETTQLSPVKKRVKEGTPPTGKVLIPYIISVINIKYSKWPPKKISRKTISSVSINISELQR